MKIMTYLIRLIVLVIFVISGLARGIVDMFLLLQIFRQDSRMPSRVEPGTGFSIC